MHHIEPLSEGLKGRSVTNPSPNPNPNPNPHPHRNPHPIPHPIPNRHLKLTQLEAMLKDMPAEARAKLVASAKGKVAARATARQASKAST